MAAVEEPFQVLVHLYRSPTRGSCAYEMGNPSSRNAVIFIGGLSDGPHTTAYTRTVARRLQAASELSYSVFEVCMKSSFVGYGTASLRSDVEDLTALVKHLRALGRDKIVLFGHSTGCQDCMEYTQYVTEKSAQVDGFILQAPISDRESLEPVSPDLQACLDLAADWIAQGKADDCLPRRVVPREFDAPMSAYRMHSLAARGGDDDFFSSDLDGETVGRLWGSFTRPVLVLHSEFDEFVPAHVDQVALNKRYREANSLVSPLSGLIPGAGHTVTADDARQWVTGRVAEFLQTLGE